MGVEPSRSELRAARERCGLKTVEALWDELLTFLFSPAVQVTETQVTEMRKAFMAGAWAVLTQVHRASDADVPLEVGAAHLEGLNADLTAFYKRLAGGHHTGRAEAAG